MRYPCLSIAGSPTRHHSVPFNELPETLCASGTEDAKGVFPQRTNHPTAIRGACIPVVPANKGLLNPAHTLQTTNANHLIQSVAIKVRSFVQDVSRQPCGRF